MTKKLTIAMAQLNQSVGDLRGNADAMIAAHSGRPDSDLIVFPELQLIGYPPEDLVLKPALWERAEAELNRLAAATAGPGPAMLVGSVFREDGNLYNGIALLADGHVQDIRYKYELPNYGTFDEKRLFTSGPLPEPIVFKGCKIGLPICEDVWFPTVCEHLKSQGAELFISVHGSPYEIEKDDLRLGQVATKRVRETGIPLLFLNRVGGQDEIVFDGASFVLNGDAGVMHQLPDWDESIVDTYWSCESGKWTCAPGEIHKLDDHPADIYNAMIVGLRDYVNRNRFPGVLLGLSGGIDSALSAAVAVDALGADRVWNVMMPSRFTSQESLDDAEGCAKMLGTRLDTIAISPAIEG
ncbi:MAG: nitrilase-related carbon-nitrogen hydrolase, partial [Parasphingorhabdus sp.]